MQFMLFNEVLFEITDPIAVIEAFCIQHNFYRKYDLVNVEERTVRLANKIGARGFPVDEAQQVIDGFHNTLELLNYDIDGLFNLPQADRGQHIEEFAQPLLHLIR